MVSLSEEAKAPQSVQTQPPHMYRQIKGVHFSSSAGHNWTNRGSKHIYVSRATQSHHLFGPISEHSLRGMSQWRSKSTPECSDTVQWYAFLVIYWSKWNK